MADFPHLIMVLITIVCIGAAVNCGVAADRFGQRKQPAYQALAIAVSIGMGAIGLGFAYAMGAAQ